MKTQRIKKLLNHRSVKLSSTVGGQRELLREHHNKINELIDTYDVLQGDIIVLKTNMRAIMGNVKPQEYCECKERIGVSSNSSDGRLYCLSCSLPTDECICNDYDGKGVSTCGFPCPVHKPQNAEVLREIENLKVDARPEIKDWILSGSKKEALAYNKAIDDVLALLVK